MIELEEGTGRTRPGRLTLSIFDLDRTLSTRPTYTAFLLFGAWRLAPLRLLLLPALPFVLLAYALGLIDRRRCKELEHHLLLGGAVPLAAAERIAAQFSRYVTSNWISAAARTQLEAERAAGNLIVIASAANSIYCNPLGQMLGADHVVATQSSCSEDHLRPTIIGANCYGRTKRDLLQGFVARQGWTRSDLHVRFFSDHMSDWPTFVWADQAFVVNPSSAFERAAERQGWSILCWR